MAKASLMVTIFFFGFVNLNDPLNAEWGYFPLSELNEINVNGFEIDNDLYFG